MTATASPNFLRAPAVDWTGKLQASMESENPHPPQDGELKSDVTRKSMWVRQNGIWQEMEVGLPETKDGIVPTAYRWSTIDRRYSGTGGATGVSGDLYMVAVFLRLGEVITALHPLFSTAGTSLTNTWLALYDDDRALLRVTEDKLTTAMTAGVPTTFTLTTPYTTVKRGLHYIGIMQAGTTRATIRGSTVSNALSAAPTLAGVSTTGLTTPSTAPATAAVITAGTILPLIYGS